MSQHDINHRGFVQDEQIARQGTLLVAFELSGGWIKLQQAVDGLGGSLCGLSEALGRSTVGAASTHFNFLAEKISRMLRTNVVLPTPGPPVITSSLCWHACRIASFCAAANSMPKRGSTQAMAFCTSMRGKGCRAVDASRWTDCANPTSAQYRLARNSHESPSTASRTTLRSPDSARYGFFDDPWLHVDQFRGAFDYARLGKATMPLARQLLERVMDSGSCPVRAVPVDA